MKDFKDSTKVQYMKSGSCNAYAKGGSVKGAAKIAKVMGEFKKGELHSGSKDGPKVTKPAQAKAIALSEARKAGAKIPVKKADGGKVGKMPPIGESVKSGNRVSKMTAAEMRAMEERFGDKKRPSAGESVKSGNRVSSQEAAEARALGVYKKGGKVAKYAQGGAVKSFNPTQALNQFSADLARRVQAGTMTKQQAQQAQTQFRNQVQLNTKAPPTRQGAEGIARNIMQSVMQPPMPEIPNVGLIDNRIGPGFGKPKQPQNPPGLGSINSGLRDFIAKQPTPMPTPMQPPRMGLMPSPPPMKGPGTPRIGYGSTDPRFKTGGLAAMPKKGKC